MFAAPGFWGFFFRFCFLGQRNEALSLSGAGLSIVISTGRKNLVWIGLVLWEESKCPDLSIFYGSVFEKVDQNTVRPVMLVFAKWRGSVG